MNAFMNVQVRILTLEARQQIRQLEAELRRFKRSVNSGGIERAAAGTDRLAGATSRYAASTNAAVAGNNRMTSSFGRAMTAGTKFGNQLQWTGRQLQYNFAMPIALGAAYATNAAFKHEAAMTRVKKVYGDGTQSADTYAKELEAIDRLVTALSNKFGYMREEVGAVAADWAAAGAEAGALARGVNLTLETAVLGEMDLATATKSLIAIQAQYGESTEGLTTIIDNLNMVENQTGLTMRDLVEAMSRSASVARTVSVGHKELAAMTAALIPATGGAAQAGNGLKTMLTRLMSPTNQAADAMERMGVEVYGTGWQSLTASERLERMAESYKGLTANQKIFVSDLVAGKWQIAKWSQLMADVGSENGYYRKALEATQDPAKVVEQRIRELNEVLESNPQKFKQAGQIIRNSFADVMIKLLPYIVFVAQKMAQLAEAFGNLNPYAQMAIMGVLAFLLVFGPLLRYMGSSLTLFATFGDALRWVGRKFLGLGGAAAAGAAMTESAQGRTTRAVGAGGAAQQGMLARTMKGMVGTTAAGWRGINAVTVAGVRATTGIEATRGAASNALQARWAARQTAMNGRHAATTTGLWASMWQQLIGIQARGQHVQTAHTARHAATTTGQHAATGSALSGLWATTWQRIVAIGARGQHVATATTARHAATSTAQHGAHARSLATIWGSTWALLTRQQGAHQAASTAQTAAGESRRAAIVTAAQTRMKAMHSAVLANTIMAEHAFHTKRKAGWAATQNFIAGGQAGWSGRMRALQAGFIASAIGAEHAFHTKRKAGFAAAQNLIAGGEAGWAARMKGISSGLLASTIAQESGSHVKRSAGWQGFHGRVTAGATAAAARMRAVTSGALAATVAQEQGAHVKRNAGWQRFFGVVSAGQTAFWARMRGTQAAGLGGMAAAEGAALTASKGRWAAHSASLGAIGKGGGAAAAGTSFGGKFVNALKGPLKIIPKLFKGPVILAIGAVIALIVHFKDEIRAIMGNVAQWGMKTFAIWVPFFQKLNNKIVEAFYRLPKGVRDAMIAVVNVVKSAAMAVYKLFSYLNPFARHSPSLVESTQRGFAEIGKQYAKMKGVGAYFGKAAADLKKFKDAAAALGRDEWADARADVAQAFPSMLPLFNTLVGHLKTLNVEARKQEAAVSRQKAVVDQWEAALDAANATLDQQQIKLDEAKDKLDLLESAYDAHAQKIQDYASAPLKGMGAMEDQIFANEQAQKKLRLEMLRWEQANGSIDEVRNRLAMLQGDIEMARGEAADLRQAGAGSDILGPIEAEIAAMEAQYDATAKAMRDSPVSQMQEELERLNREGEILELEKSLKFDEMIREIDKLVNAQQELTYDEIVAGIKKEQAAMAALEPQIAAATQAVKDQEEAVKSAQAARDAVQATYDAEKAKLDELEEEYRQTEELIRDIEAALNDMGGAAQKAVSDASKAAKEAKDMTIGEKFDALGGADLPDVGGQAGLGREGSVDDINKMIEDLTKDTAKMFGGLDMLRPIKEAWGKVKEWWATSAWPAIEPYISPIKSKMNEVWSKLFDGKGFEMSDIQDKIEEFGIWLYEWAVKAKDLALAVWRLFGPDVEGILGNAWKAIKKAGGEIWKELKQFEDLWEPIKKSWGVVWDALKVIIALGFGFAILRLQMFFEIMKNIVGPVIEWVGEMIENFIQMVRGLVQIVTGILTGDWRLAWEGVKTMIGAALDAARETIEAIFQAIVGVVWGFVKGIYDFFVWLYDELVGHSVIPDMMEAIAGWFEWLMTPVRAVLDWLAGIWGWVKDKWVEGWTAITGWFGEMWAGFQAVLQGMWDWITETLGSVWGKVVELWSAGWGAVTDWFSEKWEAFKGVMSGGFDWTKDTLGNVWTGAKDIWAKVSWDGMTGWFGDKWGKFKDVQSKSFDWTKETLGKVWDGAKGFWTTTFPAMTGWFGEKWGSFKTNVLSVNFTWIKDTLGNIWTKVKDVWGTTWGGITGFFSTKWATFKGDMDRAWTWIKDTAGGVWGSVERKWSDAWDGIKRVVKAPIDTIKGWIEDLMGLMDKAKAAAGNLNPGNWSMPSMPSFNLDMPEIKFDWQFAAGGKMVNPGSGFKTDGPTALVGEGRRAYPEFVIPTDPRYKKNAHALWGDLGVALGTLQRTGAATAPVPMLATGGVLGSVDARLNAASSRQSVTVTAGGGNVTEIHFHGDLSFPNVKSGEDADDFIRNLETLVG